MERASELRRRAVLLPLRPLFERCKRRPPGSRLRPTRDCAVLFTAVREVLSWYDEEDVGIPYGMGSDLWSLGVLLYVILSGCSPFSAEQEEAILQLVAEAKYEFHESEWSTVSADAKDLIQRLLVVDPEERMTMAQMLEHAWLKDAVAAGRASIAEKLKQRALAKQQPAAPQSNGSTIPPIVDAPEIQPRVQGVKSKGPSCCNIS